ncbi:hypothetical protein LINPERPRIM_LOCUS20886 [Linum perenne]
MGVSLKGVSARSSSRLRCCSHNREAIVLVARTPKNNGRSFFRCPYWEDNAADCGYFKWTDEKQKIDEVVSTSTGIVTNMGQSLAELRSLRAEIHRIRWEIRVLWFVSFLVLGFAYCYRV